MYGALWRLLPGGRWAKAVQSLLLIAVFVAACFLWIFPAVTPYLPFNDVTVLPVDGATTSPTP